MNIQDWHGHETVMFRKQTNKQTDITQFTSPVNPHYFRGDKMVDVMERD